MVGEFGVIIQPPARNNGCYCWCYQSTVCSIITIIIIIIKIIILRPAGWAAAAAAASSSCAWAVKTLPKSFQLGHQCVSPVPQLLQKLAATLLIIDYDRRFSPPKYSRRVVSTNRKKNEGFPSGGADFLFENSRRISGLHALVVVDIDIGINFDTIPINSKTTTIT